MDHLKKCINHSNSEILDSIFTNHRKRTLKYKLLSREMKDHLKELFEKVSLIKNINEKFLEPFHGCKKLKFIVNSNRNFTK